MVDAVRKDVVPLLLGWSNDMLCQRVSAALRVTSGRDGHPGWPTNERGAGGALPLLRGQLVLLYQPFRAMPRDLVPCID